MGTLLSSFSELATAPCLSYFPVALFRGNPEPRLSSSLSILPSTRGPCSVCAGPQAGSPTPHCTLLMRSFRALVLLLAGPRSPQLEVEALFMKCHFLLKHRQPLPLGTPSQDSHVPFQPQQVTVTQGDGGPAPIISDVDVPVCQEQHS